jgi:hypothetical protein
MELKPARPKPLSLRLYPFKDAIQFTRDGQTLLTGSGDAMIDLRDMATGCLARTI